MSKLTKTLDILAQIFLGSTVLCALAAIIYCMRYLLSEELVIAAGIMVFFIVALLWSIHRMDKKHEQKK